MTLGVQGWAFSPPTTQRELQGVNLLRDCFVLGIVLDSGTNIHASKTLLVGTEQRRPRSWEYGSDEIIKVPVLRKLAS